MENVVSCDVVLWWKKLVNLNPLIPGVHLCIIIIGCIYLNS